MQSLKGIHSREAAPLLHAGVAHLVERHVANVEAVGSNPISRSVKYGRMGERLAESLQNFLHWFKSSYDLSYLPLAQVVRALHS